MTISTYKGRPVFESSRLAELLIEILLDLRRRGHLKLHAYLVMPNQVHLLISPESLPLDETVRRIQHDFAGRIGSEEGLWQKGFVAHPVRNLRALEALRAYLHQTPVRLELTSSPELYPYSSAHRQVREF